jgi:hypothetical protein
MDGTDVLKRAFKFLQNDEVISDCGGGTYCPFCAIAQAKTALDCERGTGISDKELFEQLAFGLRECPEDYPLRDARDALLKITNTKEDWSDKENALITIQEALNGQTLEATGKASNEDPGT